MLVSWRVAGSSGCLVARVGCRRGRPAALGRTTQAAPAAGIRLPVLHRTVTLKEIEAWLLQEKDRALPKSPISEAIGYALNHWQALDGGRLAVDRQ